MRPRFQLAIPTWLAILLGGTVIATGILVTAFALLTAEAVIAAAQQPFNPLEEAAEEVAATALPPLVQEGVPVVTPLPNVPEPTPIPTLFPIDDDRVTVLVMGIDRRPGEAFISRTDTMMLVSMNTETKKVSVLSIPRDLYVVIPGFGRDRINTAFVYGAGGDNPAAGATLAMQTMEYNLGVPIDHYFMVDFRAFTGLIDSVGGIDVVVPYDIADPTYPDMNYGYDPLYIPAGPHHFDGETALKYARTRHQDNDFFRAERQQQVALALRSQLLSWDATLQAPVLYAQLREGIRTDMSLEEMISLAVMAREVEDDEIRNEVLDYDYVTSFVTPNGASVLIMNNQLAAGLIEDLFYEN